MNFKERAKIIAKEFKLDEVVAIEELTIMHQLIEQIIDIRIPIRLEGFFRTQHKFLSKAECIKAGKNKRLIKAALANNRNLYIRTEHKFVNQKK